MTIVIDAMGSDHAWFAPMLLVAVLSGYVQWFFIGHALAERIFARLSSRRLLNVSRAGVVFVFIGLTFVRFVMVRAADQTSRFFDRAMAVREGMIVDEVHSILGRAEIRRRCNHGERQSLFRRHSPGRVVFVRA